MPKDTTIESIEQLLFELEGIRRADGLLAEFDRLGSARRERTLGERKAEPFLPLVEGRGRRLLASCTKGSRHRYETLLSVELTFPSSSDYGFLIVPASQILEVELDRILVMPARSILQRLIGALGASGHHDRQAKILEEWTKTSFRATLGAASLTLLALRHGVEQRDQSIEDFLEASFRRPYRSLLATGDLGRCLDVIREKFRNPACHGTSVFSDSEYAQFMLLLFANESAWKWDLTGPALPEPGAETGVLYHHLQQSQTTDADQAGTATALERLLSVEPPPSSSVRIRVSLHDATLASHDRDVGASETHPARKFRLGDSIRFRFEANTDSYVTLIDVGTSGKVCVVWPNAWQRDCRLPGGRPCAIPPEENAPFHFTLQGRPGQEWIIAVASLAPLPLSLLPAAGEPFRTLAADEIDAFLAALSCQPPANWSVNHRSFQIVP